MEWRQQTYANNGVGKNALIAHKEDRKWNERVKKRKPERGR